MRFSREFLDLTLMNWCLLKKSKLTCAAIIPRDLPGGGAEELVLLVESGFIVPGIEPDSLATI